MNNLEKYLVDLLQNRIVINDKVVPLTKHFNQNPILPLITLDLTNAPSTFKVYREEHGEEYVFFHRTAQININCWCNTENERQSITNQILELFYKEQSNNYIFCTNYEEGNCKTLHSQCEATVLNYSQSYKCRCPNPIENGYECLSDKHNIVWGSVNIEPPFELDEINEHPPILRSVLQCEGEYIDSYEVGGIPLQSVMDDDITII